MNLEDQLARLLSATNRGMSVERLRTLLRAGGSAAGKADIVRALNGLRERGITEFDYSRSWHLRTVRDRSGASLAPSGTPDPGTPARIHAIPAIVLAGDPGAEDDAPPRGTLESGLALLKRLLPYYQACLRATDGGAPIESLDKVGDAFVLLRPDRPWWPSEAEPTRLRIPRERLPAGIIERLARSSGGRVLLGYPNQLVAPDNPDNSPFIRPVATLQCPFQIEDSGLLVELPCTTPFINPEWLRGFRQWGGGWSPEQLRSWLLLEDRDAPLQEDDEPASAPFVEMGLFARRIQDALGRRVHGQIDPALLDEWVNNPPTTGIYNVLSLVCEASGKYVRSALKDYDRLVRLQPSTFGATALAPFFGVSVPAEGSPAVLCPLPATESQLVGARAALQGPLTVITGPPGTGKSQVITALMVSAVGAGRSVLFAARQHRALDAVQERLQELTGEHRLMVRANTSERGESFSFREALTALVRSGDAPSDAQRLQAQLELASELDSARWGVLDLHRAVAVASNKAAGARESEAAAAATLQRERDTARARGLDPAVLESSAVQGWLTRLWVALLRALRIPGKPLIGSARALLVCQQGMEVATAARREAEASLAQASAAVADVDDDPVVLSGQLQKLVADLAPGLAAELECLDDAERQQLTAARGDAALIGADDPAAHSGVVELILRHMPVWAVTTLGTGSRIPLRAGLFDYVIFDEASQTDIASALPLLFRAKRAVVVGDPHQLAMINSLQPREERALLLQYDLLRAGIGLYAQGRTSLFDLAASMPSARRFMLTDHFRCHPEIAGYINEAFYGRRLAPLTDVKALRIPRGMKPGLHWTHIHGEVIRRGAGAPSGSAASPAEADAVAEAVRVLASSDFEGTIGVVSFFAYQAQEIQRRVTRLVDSHAMERHRIKVFTANKFQGDERDVILLSLCMHPDMPPGALNFIRTERRLLNVAVSRARAICHVFGDREYAERCGIAHVETLARRVLYREDRSRRRGTDDIFDSPWERQLHDALVAVGLRPMPQYPVAGRFLDLAIEAETAAGTVRLDIEVDGVAYHQDDDGDRLSTDLWRDHQLRSLGWKVIRFWVHELRDDMEVCIERIRAAID